MSKNTGFLTDFKTIQVISGIAATSGIFMTVAAIFIFPISNQAKINIIIATSITFVFILVYYLTPKLYMNKKFSFVSDLFYIVGISIVMANLGEHAYIYFIFYMILAAIDAFIFPLYQYAIIIFGMIVGIFLSNPTEAFIISGSFAYQIYGLLVLAAVLHMISREALKVKEKKEVMECDIEALENDKREIRTLLESLSDGMFVVDAYNKITFYNKSALRILNIVAPEEKILNRDINDFMPIIGLKGPESITREVFGSLESSIRNDFRIVQSDKTLRLHTNITPIVGEKGKLQGGIIFFRDITDEKMIEEQRAEFNAVASHELRTPLSVIEGYLYFILDPTSNAKYDNITKENLERAHEAAKDLTRLVTDILTVVKAEEGNLEVKLRKVDLKKLVRNAVDDHRRSAKDKKIELIFKITAKSPIPTIVTDLVKVREVVSNLISNAIKFTKKGTVIVELGLLKEEIIVSVIDTGVGIEKKDLTHVYQKFSRIEDWKTRKTTGAGLGLYIVKTLTERLGGRTGVQSEIGKGSKFYFTLPIETEILKESRTEIRRV